MKKPTTAVAAHSDCNEGGALCFHPNGSAIVTGGADEPRIWPLDKSVSPTNIQLTPVESGNLDKHESNILSIEFSPDGRSFVTGSSDHVVNMFTFTPTTSNDGKKPGSESKFLEVVTRFEGVASSVAFSPNGLVIAASTDDIIRLVDVADVNKVTVLRAPEAYQHPIVCICYDPKGKYLVSLTENGVVLVWDLAKKAVCHTYSSAFSRKLVECTANIQFDPSGNLLAIPSSAESVVFLKRDTWEKALEISSKETKKKCVYRVQWSPNGVYLATVGEEGVTVWDMQNGRKEKVENYKKEEIIEVRWKPDDNMLAALTKEGNLCLWNEVVPKGATLPHEKKDQVDWSAILFPSDEEVQEGSKEMTSKSYNVAETPYTIEQRGRRRRLADELSYEKHTESSDHTRMDYESGQTPRFDLGSALPQKSFQPASTPCVGKAYYLAWNMVGSIVIKEDTYQNTLVIKFADSSKNKDKRLRDVLGVKFGALSSTGAVFGVPQTPGSNEATIVFQSFAGWTSVNSWTRALGDGGDDVLGVAIGSRFIAAACSSGLLRSFEWCGLEQLPLQMPGQYVTMVGSGSTLAYVYHHSAPVGDCQNLHLILYDFMDNREVWRGPLAVAYGATLTWIGFSEQGAVAIADSSGMVYMLLEHRGWNWIPIADLKRGANEFEQRFVVAITAEYDILCTVTTNHEQWRTEPLYPTPLPNADPPLKAIKARIPLLNRDQRHNHMQAVFLLREVNLGFVDDEEKQHELKVALDKDRLKLINDACRSNQPVRALDVASHLYLPNSLQIAETLANACNLKTLVSKLSLLRQLKMQSWAEAESDDESSDSESEDDASEEDAVTPIHRRPPPKVVEPLKRRQTREERLAAIRSSTKLDNAKPATPVITKDMPTKARPVGVPSPDPSSDEEESDEESDVIHASMPTAPEEASPTTPSALEKTPSPSKSKHLAPPRKNPFAKAVQTSPLSPRKAGRSITAAITDIARDDKGQKRKGSPLNTQQRRVSRKVF